MKSFGRVLDLIFACVVVVWVIPHLAGLIADLFKPIASSIDPAGVFLWISVHHVSQLALTIFLMKLFCPKLSAWGFNCCQCRLSLRIFASFCLIYLIPVFLYNVVPNLGSGKPPSFDYPLTPGNVAGVLGFQFLLSGMCEEPLFRGFAMSLLAQSWKGNVRTWSVDFPISGLWATLFFMAAHVNVSLRPFSVSASFWQQVFALGLGLYYAAAFHKTRSLLAPILSHGYSNGVIFVLLYAWALLAR